MTRPPMDVSKCESMGGNFFNFDRMNHAAAAKHSNFYLSLKKGVFLHIVMQQMRL